MDPNNRVALAEMRGDIKLILAGQERAHTDVQEIRRTLGEHSQRLGLLETDKTLRDGERTAFRFSGKIAWSAVSLICGGGGVFAIMEFIK